MDYQKPHIEMRKRARTESGSSILENVHLLRRLLTSEAALVQPGMLCAVSRNVCRTVKEAMNGPGFWRDLTMRCMPMFTMLPRDAAYFLQRGRFGRPDSDDAQNTAWRLNYTRLVKTILHTKLHFTSTCGTSGVMDMVDYRPHTCHGIDVLFNRVVKNATFRLNSCNSQINFSVSFEGVASSIYSFANGPWVKTAWKMFSDMMIFDFNRRWDVLVVSIFLNWAELTETHYCISKMPMLEPPGIGIYAGETCIVKVRHGPDAWLEHEVLDADLVSAMIPQIMKGLLPGHYRIVGPQFADHLSFFWDDANFIYFPSYYVGDFLARNRLMAIRPDE